MTTTQQRPTRRHHAIPTTAPTYAPPPPRPAGYGPARTVHPTHSAPPTAPGWADAVFSRPTPGPVPPEYRTRSAGRGGGFGAAALVLTALATVLAMGLGALGVWAVVVGLPATGERVVPVSDSGRGTSAPGTATVPPTVPTPPTTAAVGSFPGARSDDVVGYRGGTVTLAGMQVSPQKLRAVSNAYGPATKCGTVTYTNVGSTEKSFGPFDWTLQSPSGVGSSPVYASVGTLLTAGTLAPGGSVTGDVCFATSAPLAGWVLLYQPGFSSSAPRAAFLG